MTKFSAFVKRQFLPQKLPCPLPSLPNLSNPIFTAPDNLTMSVEIWPKLFEPDNGMTKFGYIHQKAGFTPKHFTMCGEAV
jgi:hypothetical protein